MSPTQTVRTWSLRAAWWAALIGALMLTSSAGHSSAPRNVFYSTTPLPAEPGERAVTAGALNDAGQAVLVAHPTGSGPTRSYLWDQGTRTDLGSLSDGGTVALDLNNLGQVTGWAVEADGRRSTFVWSAGDLRRLPTPAGFVHSEGLAINDAGVVAGCVYGETALQACVWDESGAHLLSTPGLPFSRAYDLNENGEVVGAAYPVLASVRTGSGVVWRDGTPTYLAPAPGYSWSEALAINEPGEVVGTSYERGFQAGTAWTAVGTHRLRMNFYRANAAAINDAGQIVGQMNTLPRSGAPRAALWWSRADTPLELSWHTSLPSSDWEYIGDALDVNNRGQILTTHRTDDYGVRPLILTPLTSDLSVTALESKRDAAVGETVTLRASITNQGLHTLPFAWLTLSAETGLEFLSASLGGQPSTGGRNVSFLSLQDLAAGSSIELTLTARVLAAGNLRATVNARGQGDANAANDSAEWNVQVAGEPLPELAGELGEIFIGDDARGKPAVRRVIGQFSIWNGGTARARPFVVRFYLSPVRGTAPEALLVRRFTVRSLPAGEGVELSLYELAPSNFRRYRYAVVVIDADRQARESDEANNMLVRSLGMSPQGQGGKGEVRR